MMSIIDRIDKRLLNFLVIAIVSSISIFWTSFIFHESFNYEFLALVIVARWIASFFILKDYSLSWSKATQKTFLIKSAVNLSAFVLYLPIFYLKIEISFMVSELFSYLFIMTFLMYMYYYFINKSDVLKTKSVVIYGAGKAGIKLEQEFLNSEYRTICFIDDDKILQKRSIDNINILSPSSFKKRFQNEKMELLVIAMPSSQKEVVQKIYEELQPHFDEVQILPSLDAILRNHSFVNQLKHISVEDLLARHPKDLDKKEIANFIRGKRVLITGAGGSIGSEIARQCKQYEALHVVALDHSEYNLYQIEQELSDFNITPIMCSVTNIVSLESVFKNHRIDIVIHAAAYKHVPLVESNVDDAIANNVFGTKNTIDLAIKYGVEKFILISTDKAVRPTNVMGTTKRICELYAQNVDAKKTEIVAVRFGNVLGSSGSVIPKFRAQIEANQNITVTHPDITRYFMLIPEACELVLQAGAIAQGGEIFILDMGESIKIVDLATKMIELSGREDIKIEFTGLRPGEKLYEELLIDESSVTTKYESITVGQPTLYEIDKLNSDLNELKNSINKLEVLKKIVPEFNHQLNH
ncbi:MAG: nucleoside-diphosphate sugar epimerase/dehydratase [Campylobacterota bacterium]|nr:nucleoside-diphosphate sugar epimerase/dehydratase [Campylobacterota bacterium]